MKPTLSAYETYYQHVGLTQYAVVFERNKEKQFEAALCARHLSRWFSGAAHGRTLRVLDIGCGLGGFTCLLLDSLHAALPRTVKRPAVVCDLIDMNPTAFEHFRANASKVESCQISVDRCLCQPWQTVRPAQLETAYDLVIANHSFYGCPCDERLARSLFDAMAPNGRGVVTLVSKQAPLTRLRAAAGIPNNGGEDFEAAINGIFCNYTRLVYDSKFRFDPNDRRYIDWFFAGGEVFEPDRARLLPEYSKSDAESPYIPNRAMIHIIEALASPI